MIKNHDERIECRPYTEFRATSNCFKSFLHLLDVQTSIPDVQTHNKQRPFNMWIFIRVIHQA